MPYYTNPYGNDGNKSNIMALYEPFKTNANVISPDVFAQQTYDRHLSDAGSPYTEGSDFGWIYQNIADSYLNQPELTKLRNGTALHVADNPSVKSWLDQTQAQAVSNADATRNSGGGGLLGKGGWGGALGSLAGIALAPYTGGSSLMWGAIGGGLGSAATGGNPLTGAVLGGLGGWGWDALGGAGLLSGAESGLQAVDYGLTAGGIPSLSTYGATGLAGTGAPMLSTYGMGGLAGTGASSLGTLAGTAGLTGSALAGSGDWWNTAKSAYNTASTANKTYNAANSLFGSPAETSGNSGGNMADTNWANTLSPFLSAANTWNQSGNTADTYDKAYNLITTPSPDQQKYRDQLALLMSNPGSMESSPVYQAMAEQGMNNVNRTAAAKGMLGSGNRLAELMKVGQDTASKYYFPQVNALSDLSGVRGDSGTRAMGADSLIRGNTTQNEMQTSMLKDLMGGMGVQSPQQQFIDAMLGKTGTGGTNPLMAALNKAFGGGANGGTGADWSFDTSGANTAYDGTWQSGGLDTASPNYQTWDDYGTAPNNDDWFNNLLAYSGDNAAMDTSVNTWGW